MKPELCLYIAGDDAVSQSAVANFRRIVNECGPQVDARVVDVVERPELARELRIMATPILVRLAPPPVRKVLGDLQDTARVITVLGLNSDEVPGEQQ